MYIKAGCTLLAGYISPINKSFTVKNNNFRKTTPLFAVGLSRNINKHCELSVEFSKTMKTSKNLTIATSYGSTINNKAKISRATVAILMTYKL
jgi:hypothetical protein